MEISIRKRREMAKNPALATLEYLERLEKISREEIERALDEFIAEKRTELGEYVTRLLQKTNKELEAFQAFKADIPLLREQLIGQLKGAKGERGQVGLRGERGAGGSDGKDGKSGEPGKAGKDGSPDKPLQIADKLNTTESSVEQKVIKGLSQKLTFLERLLRERTKGGGTGGGGMGQVQHEKTAVSSATTTVATTYNIAGGGLALWAFYNGQMIARGTDYTVSGKTLTLLFTPQDSTTFDVIYFRAS